MYVDELTWWSSIMNLCEFDNLQQPLLQVLFFLDIEYIYLHAYIYK